eukprot:TRINITY_DN2193_c0_g1_i1.p1 TRINITY_DN2193_c0_g1~~TRINITY_DN2193_c0_g1_i1.p1  ORF type:complete len:603 (-),score=143.64 TRINITY_DN2193_c0_g1_i1:399-2207(-)
MRRHLLVLGNGWGGMRVLRDVDKNKYRVTCVAPRNHFVFTPLLASTAVGTLEFRNAAEPVRHIAPGVDFLQAECLSLDLGRRVATCASVFNPSHLVSGYAVATDTFRSPTPLTHDARLNFPSAHARNPPEHHDDDPLDRRQAFTLEFDDVVIGVGSESNTFGAPGVEEHAMFLKEITDAQRIRQRIVHNFELASGLACTVEQARTLLHFVVVGGGPTGVEFAAELADFLERDLRVAFPRVAPHAHITVLDPTGVLLGTFDKNLSSWAMRRFSSRGIDVRRAAVAAVGPHSVRLTSGQTVSCGLVVWSTGVTPVSFVRGEEAHNLARCPKSGRLRVDGWLRCHPLPRTMLSSAADDKRALPNPDTPEPADGAKASVPGAAKPKAKELPPPLDYVFAIGDCADAECRGTPMTAQAAQQQAIYLAKLLNSTAGYSGGRWELTGSPPPPEVDTQVAGEDPQKPKPREIRGSLQVPWVLKPRGSMAYIGGYRALVQLPDWSHSGILAWVLWRSAYFTMLVSWRNKFLVPLQWMKTSLFGRDTSYLYDWRKVCQRFPIDTKSNPRAAGRQPPEAPPQADQREAREAARRVARDDALRRTLEERKRDGL